MPETSKEQRYIDEHERLADLLIADRFAFELERKKLLQELVNFTRPEKLQNEWDKILNGMGSAENRFAMISLFSDIIS